MLKEIKYIFYLLTIFFSVFFIIKFYLSENNIKRSNKVLIQHQNKLDIKFNALPIIKNDTKDIIIYQNENDQFKKKKKRKCWELLK